MNKKEMPLILIIQFKAAKDYLRVMVNDSDIIELENDDLTSIKIIDSDPDSKFFFEIYKLLLIKNIPYLNIRYTPTNETTLSEHNHLIQLGELSKIFDNWLSIIIRYNTISLLPEDQILKTYEQEFFAEFEIVDDGAASEPFNLKQQLLLDNYLESVVSILIGHNSEEELNEIIGDTISLRDSMTSLTKKVFVQKISKILAKIMKHGLPLIKEVFSEVKKQLIKKAIEGSFEGFEHLFLK